MADDDTARRAFRAGFFSGCLYANMDCLPVALDYEIYVMNVVNSEVTLDDGDIEIAWQAFQQKEAANGRTKDPADGA